MLIENMQNNLVEKMNHRFDEIKEQNATIKAIEEKNAKESRAIRRENRELKKMLKELLTNQIKNKK